MSLSLPSEQHRALKKQAHHLKTIVTTGAAGLTDAVSAEIDRALHDHELVKIKLVADDRSARKRMTESICERLEAACVQQIGHTATFYRPRPSQDD